MKAYVGRATFLVETLSFGLTVFFYCMQQGAPVSQCKKTNKDDPPHLCVTILSRDWKSVTLCLSRCSRLFVSRDVYQMQQHLQPSKRRVSVREFVRACMCECVSSRHISPHRRNCMVRDPLTHMHKTHVPNTCADQAQWPIIMSVSKYVLRCHREV